MLVFHALLFARPNEQLSEAYVELRGVGWQTLQVPPEELHRGWTQTWEETMQKLELLPRLYAELDGSFTWHTDDCQIAGVLYDRNDKMCYAELFGNCSSSVLDQFLTACGWPTQAFVFQLPREGITLAEEDFRRFVELS